MRKYHKKWPISSVKEVACVLNKHGPTSMDDIGAATGLPDEEVERAIRMLLMDDLCFYATKKGNDGYVARYDPLYERSLEIYWDKTRDGTHAIIKYRRCIGCEKGFWSRSATDCRCKACGERKWE